MHEMYTCKLRSKWAEMILFHLLSGKRLRFQVELPVLRNKTTQRTNILRGGYHSEDKHIREHHVEMV